MGSEPETGQLGLAPTLGPEDIPEGDRATVMGTTVGRFTVTGILGEGGMGVVVAAHDRALDREVALKLVRTLGDERLSSDGQARLLREARAMAKLRHPNVLTVYEAGVQDDEVFLAMERIHGGTLRDLVARCEPVEWKRIVDAFAAAGEGLAAAHDAKLVHRDFKPDNVLIEGERVLVSDFGLVGAVGPGAEQNVRESGWRSELGVDDVRTLEGTVMGTPAYMSPEQMMGGTVDAPSDQFSFCVALYEALYGRLPYEGHRGPALLAAMREGRLRRPQNAVVPSWIGDALTRGLAFDPEDRHPSMRDLLEALTADPSQRRAGTRRRRLGVGAVALVVVAWAGLSLLVPYELDYSAMAIIDLGFLVMLGAVALRIRGDLLPGSFNRRVLLTGLTAVLGVLTALTGAWVGGFSAAEAALLHPLVTCCVGLAAASLLDQRILVVAIGYAAAYFISAARYELFFPATLLAHGLMAITLYLVLDERPPNERK